MNATPRQYRVAKKIQAVAVDLAARDGLGNVTTEAIARQAGISTRTFFNYYPYKEAAIVGPPPDYPTDASEAFVAARGRLIDDLDRLITAHLKRFLGEREMLGQILALAGTDPKLEALLNSAVLSRRAQMAQLLARRLPDADPCMVEILAAAVVAATNAATRQWAAGTAPDFVAAARHNIALITASAALLDQPGDAA